MKNIFITFLILSSGLLFAQNFPHGRTVDAPSYTHRGNVEITNHLTVDSTIQFAPIDDVSVYSEGLVYYDSNEHTLVVLNDESEIGMNVGEEMWIKVRNDSGDSISNGTPVYISGAIGQLPTIAPANASVFATAHFAGLATHTIENNSNGYITVHGIVRGIDTDGSPYGESWSDGDEIYVGITAGALTNVEPTNGYYVHHVGFVAHAHTQQGKLLILSHPDFHNIFRVEFLQVDSSLNFANLPTDSTGLNTGDLYRIANQVYWKY